MKEDMKKRVIGLVISLAITALISFVIFYVFLPPLSVFSGAFWVYLFVILLMVAISLGVFSIKVLVDKTKSGKQRNNGHPYFDKTEIHFINSGIAAKICFGIMIVPIAVLILGNLISSQIFNAKRYANIIEVEEGVFAEDMPETSEVTNVALMDTESARKLGNKKMGALANVVSQYVVSDVYTQINYQGKPMKITNLEYADFFKWFNNRNKGIPGYIMVDPVANNAEYYELKTPMKYTYSSYFSHDLLRKLRFDYPTKIFGNISFEVNDEGEVFFIVSCVKPKVGLFGAKDVNEIIMFNPCDGTSEVYALEDVPKWVDIVFDGDLACKKYDWKGLLSGGFINSVIGNKDCKITTADFGYIMLDDDVWYFTGVTSVTSDQSNIGFILSNARTGKYKFYSVMGAEEFSAMRAAEGEVQEKKYVASFPTLVNIAGSPTYIMVLKDAAGLVKLYALVNVEQFNLVATGETQEQAIAAYKKKLLATNVPEIDDSESVKTADITVKDIKFLNMSDTSYVYMTDNEGKVYKMEFNDANEGVVFVKVGDKLTVKYMEEPNKNINLIIKWEIKQ